MPRVLMLSTDLERGGLPLRLVRLADRLRTMGVEPVVGCLGPPGPLSGELRQLGIDAFSCDARGRWDVSCLGQLARHITRINPDLVHASLFHANLAVRLVGRHDRDRPIITATVTVEIERHWHRWVEAATIGQSDVHVANSTAVAEHLRDDLGVPSSRLVVIPNGLDLDVIDRAPAIDRGAYGIDSRARLVVWAGRMDPVKGLFTFVDVMDRLGERANVCGVLLGDGPERRAVESWIKERGLSDIVRVPGWSDNVASWLKAADCLLFPSRTEGCPNAVLEAMACGCPIVASDIPAIRELIVHGASGRLCGVGDVSAFAMALADVLEDPRRARAGAAAAQAKVRKEFGLDPVAGKWADLYRRLVL